jgi:hypothetical protein
MRADESFAQKRNYRLASNAAAAGVYTFRYWNLIKVPRESMRKMKRDRQNGIRTRGAGDVHRLEVARLDHCHREAAGGGQVAQGQHQLAQLLLLLQFHAHKTHVIKVNDRESICIAL